MRTTRLDEYKTYFIFGYWEDFADAGNSLIPSSNGLIKIR